MDSTDRNHWRRQTTTLTVLALAFVMGCDRSTTSPTTDTSADFRAVAQAGSSPLHPVTIRPAPQPKLIATGLEQAGATTVACATCHTTRVANRQNRSTKDLDQFHQGLKLNHGRLACVACHDSQDGYAGLHLADGTAVAFADTMQLCAQCHGTQFRDYQHGSHGGMTGHWDRTRGPRERNHCLHCHDPHAPQIAVVQPVAGPRDRFPPAKHEAQHD